jgi:hypothetical protein
MSQTPKQIAAGQRRSLMAMKKKLLVMSAEWGDLDGWCERLLEGLADDVQEAFDNLVIDDGCSS